MKKFIFLAPVVFLLSCHSKIANQSSEQKLNSLARDYVKLGLAIGQYDADFVDAYYGPDSLKPAGLKSAVFPKDSFLSAVDRLMGTLKNFSSNENDKILRQRADWMVSQLVAFSRRIKIFSGEYVAFDQEAKELFGVQAPVYQEDYFKKLVKQMNDLLPGGGNLGQRLQALSNRFVIPKSKLDTVFKASIAECRRTTLQHYPLPSTENFQLEFVTNKSWSGYNWYKGNYTSLIQINTDLPILIDRAIDVGSHESYPGHHVYNMLLEKNLYRDKGWVEISLYPLFSPQSLIAEGSANYGIEVVFPGEEKVSFSRNVLLPLAGLDTAGIHLYYDLLALRGKLNYARNEVARGILNHTMSEEEGLRWLVEYGGSSEESAKKSISFIKAYRSYVINYNYGMDLVKDYIERNGGIEAAPEKRWQLFGWLLSNAVIPSDLLKK